MINPQPHTKLTPTQKLAAIDNRFYGGLVWEPQTGDYYTTPRNDLELYRIVAIDDGTVKTVYAQGQEELPAEWTEDEFLSPDGFGKYRIHVPDWVLELY